jgi:hypothetical protein
MFVPKLGTIMEATKPIYYLYNMLDHIDIEYKAYGMPKNALYMLLPPVDQCTDWSLQDINKWCDYTYRYLNMARTNTCVAVYLARLWQLSCKEHMRILKHVATRFKTGQLSYTMGLQQAKWSSILK